MSDFEKQWRTRCHEKGYTDKQCDEALELGGKIVVGTAKCALTVATCAIGGVANIFKRGAFSKSCELSKKWYWTKRAD